MQTLTEENYLKSIFKLDKEMDSGHISTNSIAKELGTSAASVTDMLKRLSEKGLIDYKKYKGVQLTPSGKKIALSIVRRHRLWECFLVDKLNFKWDEVHDLAEELEHMGSKELTRRLDAFLGQPKFDPHGDPIPGPDGTIKRKDATRLSDLRSGEAGLVTGVREQDPEFLQYLDKLNINLGSRLKVVERFKFDQSERVKINGKNEVHLNFNVTRNILVGKEE